ncbi:MAG: hypothetical protein J7502_04765, partial [Flavisolibacter sp.]|nr:hypothetical protein [Flavisolibacter sp.]
GWAFKILWWLEKKQTRKASHLIAVASGMNEYVKEKYDVTIKDLAIKPCCVNLELFHFNDNYRCELRKSLDWQSKVVCVYAGKFGGIYLEKEAFDFFKVAYEYWGDQFRVLLLTSLTKTEVADYCKAAGLTERIFHVEYIPFDKMPHYLSAGDFGFTPVKPVPSKRYCSPIKDGEYWAMGLPVVITKNISDDSAIIEQNNIGAVLNELTKEGYWKAVKKIDELLQSDREKLRGKIRSIAVTYRGFDIAKREYSKIYS